MKFCVQPPIRHPFALANFQLGRKGQRPKGRKVKRPNFQKLSEAFLIKSKVVPDVFMSIFKLKGPISRNYVLELIVGPKNIHQFSIPSILSGKAKLSMASCYFA